MLTQNTLPVISLMSRMVRGTGSNILTLVELLLSNPVSNCRVALRITLVHTGHQANNVCTPLFWYQASGKVPNKGQESRCQC